MVARTPSGSDRRPDSGLTVFIVPLALTGALLAIGLLPRIRASEPLAWSFWGAAMGLLGWQAVLAARALREGTRGLTFAPPRPQHYIQTCCQLGIYAYWGWFWPPVYPFASLLLGQLVFAYAFDLLLAWTRRQDFLLGFGPVPIILSINFFLWFKDDWFAWQFVLVALGFLGKAFVRWERDGRRVHIFNPSAFTLAVFSIVILATGTTNSHTWAEEIVTTFGMGPHAYVVIFAVGLVVMFFFATTPVTASAAVTMFGASAVYLAVSGVPYFVDSEIPAAVFLGLHLLITDPATSPRTPFGRVIFGVLYGLGVFLMYGLLFALGLPTFYDKLLCVPLLNLLVPAIDRAVEQLGTPLVLDRIGLAGVPGRHNLAHIAVWVLFFGLMTARGATDGMHRGDALPFWQQACAEDRPQACRRLLNIEASYCGDNAGWACNEMGRHFMDGRLVPADRERALAYFSRACEARFQPGCVNLLDESDVAQAQPRVLDLRLLLREGGPNLMDMGEPDLYARACRHGWSFACDKASASR